MADDTQYVPVTGPDGRQYKFPPGTTKEKAVAYFKAKGISAKPLGEPPTPEKKTGYVEDVQSFFRRIAKESGQAAQREAGILSGPEAERASLVRRAAAPFAATAYSANEVAAKTLGGTLGALSDPKALAALVANRFLPGVAPLYFGGLGVKGAYEAAKQPMTPEAVQDMFLSASIVPFSVAGVKESIPSAADLRAEAARTMTKVAGEGTITKADPLGVATGKELAKSGIKTNKLRGEKAYLDLYRKTEGARSSRETQAQQIAQRLRGQTIDVSQDIAPMVKNARDVLNNRGVLDAATEKQIRAFLFQLENKMDMSTGKFVPRDLTKVPVQDALGLLHGKGLLSEWSEFTKTRPDAVNNLARDIRGRFNERVGQLSPELARIRAEESQLIKARDSFKEQYEKALTDKATTIKSLFRSGIGTLGAYVLLREAGLGGWIGAYAGALVIANLVKSPAWRSNRAAFDMWLADVSERMSRGQPYQGPAQRTTTPPTMPPMPPQGGAGPTGGPMPSGAPPTPTAPTSSQGGPPQAVSATPTTSYGPTAGQPPKLASTIAATEKAIPGFAARPDAVDLALKDLAAQQEQIKMLREAVPTTKLPPSTGYKPSVKGVPATETEARAKIRKEQVAGYQAKFRETHPETKTALPLETIPEKATATKKSVTAAPQASPELRLQAEQAFYTEVAKLGGPEVAKNIKATMKALGGFNAEAAIEALEFLRKNQDKLNKPSSKVEIQEIIANPNTSGWLKNTLKSGMDRDPVDMANDSEVLLEILSNKSLDEIDKQAAILTDPTASYWIKDALKGAIARENKTLALSEARKLAQLLKSYADSILH